MSSETAGADELTRPKFRGCIICYSAEWAYYGAKKAAGTVSSED